VALWQRGGKPEGTVSYRGMLTVVMLAGVTAGCAGSGGPESLAHEGIVSTADLVRREIAYGGPYRPGTIVVKTAERRLYWIEPEGRAIRYAVGVGREEGLNFRGAAHVGRKAEWPSWTPTESMMRRLPHYRAYAGGLPGGIDNPLGARALYLYRDGRDTHFRLHGTNDPATIGTAVSSGCIRLTNEDVVDLYGRAPIGTPVVVVRN
jgi:lipoprotein-anchoring transpeptidase ErfK/SrfK